MKRAGIMLLGVITVCPLAYMFFFFVNIFGTIVTSSVSGSDFGMIIPFEILFILHGLTILLMFCLLAFYITFLFRTDKINNDKKTLWALVLFMGNILSMPVFWYLYLWRNTQIEEKRISTSKNAMQNID